MSGSPSAAPRVFISYSHDSDEHRERVLSLAGALISQGVDCWIDQYIENPPQGWPLWMERQVEEAHHVLVVCTETYSRRFEGNEERGKGKGAIWEGAIITTSLYENSNRNDKFIPVLLNPEDSAHIPKVLSSVTRYDLSSDAGFERLYRRITNQPEVMRPALGAIVNLSASEQRKENGWNLQDTKGTPLTNRRRLFEYVHRMLDENKLIFDTVGPDSALAMSDGLSTGAIRWRSLKRQQIIPNNSLIIEAIEQHAELLTTEEWHTFQIFKQHALGLEANVDGRHDRSSIPTFPEEFESMIRRGLASG